MVPRISFAVSVLCTFAVAVFAAGLPKYVLDSKAQCYSLLDPANDEPILYFGALGDASYSALTWHESSIGFYGSPGHDELVRAKFTAEGVMFKIRHYSSDSSLHDVGFARHKRCNLVLDADPELPVSGSVDRWFVHGVIF
ncbi:hypothetical protein GQ42DRAFT_153139 [Ramicandelaber brevisporus]|nr:hypothetical protein GQ42DRAFT_153139 [Ramicandelaber brevisporus]